MKVAIIGGYGKMGEWLARFLLKDGKQVVIAGRDQAKLREAAQRLRVESATSSEAVKQSDAVILSVPIDKFEQIVSDIAPYTSPQQLIFDVTSIKAAPVAILHKYIKNGSVLGIHPMFGPGADGIAGQRFVLTPTSKAEGETAVKVRKYLEGKGARVAVMSPAEHDELMAIVLGLSHFIGLVTADTLLDLGKIKESSAVSGTTYRLLLTMAESVASEDPEFYSSLQMNLPGLDKIERLFAEKAGKWLDLVNKKEGRQFADRMKDIRKRLVEADPDFERAYRELYGLTGK
ncbi:MAG: prephenate dehydrogenase [Dehalococcoidia bacterium]|jgi:prephenate dehydrogenase